jgi:hypothetical protein
MTLRPLNQPTRLHLHFLKDYGILPHLFFTALSTFFTPIHSLLLVYKLAQRHRAEHGL